MHMNMISEQKFQYDYRLIKTSWGISISFLGVLYNGETVELEYETIENKIKYIVSNKISEKEKELLIKGLQLFYNFCLNNAPLPMEMIVYFDNITYDLSDYQDEGIIVGTIECLSYLLNLNSPMIKSYFDKARNKYCYCLNNATLESLLNY